MNISNHEIPFAGVIEYTNLNPRNDLQGSHIVYLPQYIPEDDPDYASPDWVERAVESLKEISPGFSEEVILEKHVHRSPIAQPICNLSFTKSIVPIESTIRGLYVTDSSQLHPDDRTMSNSISMGYNAAQAVCENE